MTRPPAPEAEPTVVDEAACAAGETAVDEPACEAGETAVDEPACAAGETAVDEPACAPGETRVDEPVALAPDATTEAVTQRWAPPDPAADTLYETRAAGALPDPAPALAPAPAPAPSALAPEAEGLTGHRLLDRYQIGERLGSGGMGTVYRATDELKRAGGEEADVAIKVMDVAKVGDRLDALVQEVSRSHRVSHPNILRVHEIHVDRGLAFITMELLEGQTLQDRLRDALARDDGPRVPLLPVQEVDRVAESLCHALVHCHERKLVHSDIKPANIFLCTDGVVKLLDLGIAQIIGIRGSLRGYSALYSSPQQMAGHLADPSDDLFSVGCTLYECLTGAHPFGGQTSTAAHASGYEADVSILPRRYRRAIASALAHDPSARPASARHLWRRIDPRVRRRKAAAAGLALLTAAGIAGASWLGQSIGESRIAVSPERQRAAEELFRRASALEASDPAGARSALRDAVRANPYHEEAARSLALHVRAVPPADPTAYSLAWSDWAEALEAAPTSEALVGLGRERVDALLASDPAGMARSEVLSVFRAPLCVLPKLDYRTGELERRRSELRVRC